MDKRPPVAARHSPKAPDFRTRARRATSKIFFGCLSSLMATTIGNMRLVRDISWAAKRDVDPIPPLKRVVRRRSQILPSPVATQRGCPELIQE